MAGLVTGFDSKACPQKGTSVVHYLTKEQMRELWNELDGVSPPWNGEDITLSSIPWIIFRVGTGVSV
jgi:hypothetical protein